MRGGFLLMAPWKRKRRPDTVEDAVGGCPARGHVSCGAAGSSRKPAEGGGDLAITKGTCDLQSVSVTNFWGQFI